MKHANLSTRLHAIVLRLREACADPDGPLYGSDLVPLIGDLIEETLQICSERDAATERVDDLESQVEAWKHGL